MIITRSHSTPWKRLPPRNWQEAARDTPLSLNIAKGLGGIVLFLFLLIIGMNVLLLALFAGSLACLLYDGPCRALWNRLRPGDSIPTKT